MNSKNQKNQKVKTKLSGKAMLSFFAIFFAASITLGQLRGSGNIITKKYDYKYFNQLSFLDLDGRIEVEIGKEFNITVAIDDNLFSLLSFEENSFENELKIFFKNNTQNIKYIENCHLKIKIIMPRITQIKHKGNSSLIISNLIEPNFKIENLGNGSAKFAGFIDNLEVINRGNGSTLAKELFAKNAKIICSGNGNVIINVSTALNAQATGNSRVINYGSARYNIKSSKSGNAELINKLK